MKAFTIDAESNITVFPSRKAAETNLPPTGAFVFTTAAGLQSYLEKFPVTSQCEARLDTCQVLAEPGTEKRKCYGIR